MVRASGCGDDDRGRGVRGGGATPTHWSAEQTWSSAHFVYHAKPDDDSVDATVVAALEAHAAVIASQWLGLPAGSWGPIDYFKYHSEIELVAAGSPCGDRPCTTLFDSGRVEIHTPLAIDEHEMTHGYVIGSTCAPPLFREGLAVSASCDPADEPLYLTAADGRPGSTSRGATSATSRDPRRPRTSRRARWSRGLSTNGAFPRSSRSIAASVAT